MLINPHIVCAVVIKIGYRPTPNCSPFPIKTENGVSQTLLLSGNSRFSQCPCKYEEILEA